MQAIGEIKALYRHPVKSFQGEQLESSRVEPYGFYGDRAYYFVDHSRSNKHLSAKQVPGLLGYAARYIGDASGGGFPEMELLSPDGRRLQWNEELWREIGELARRPLTPGNFVPGNGGLLAVDEAPILMASDVSLQQVSEMVGLAADIRQFRPNIVMHPYGQMPFEEFEWLGQKLKIGEIEIQISKKCERCSMVNVIPERLATETRFLKKLAEKLDACFGVYAEVIKTGTVSVGDKVYMCS